MASKHRRRSGSVAALAASCTMLLAGCTIESPELPTFESEWIVPLGTIDETVASLIEAEPDFVIGADGSITLSTSGELDAVALGDQLDIDVEGIDFLAEIGTLHIDATPPVGFAHRLGAIYPLAESLDGFTTTVPSFTFDLDSDPQDLPGFRSATLVNGGLELDVVNGLPVAIGGAGGPEQLVIVLVDPADDAVIVQFVVPVEIAAGATHGETIDLAGTTLPDSVGVRLTGGSAGSGSSPVLVDADAELEVSVRTTDLTASSAEATFGAQDFETVSRVGLPDSVRVLHATVSRGDLVLNLRNDLPVAVSAEIEIPGFVDAQNRALSIPLAMPAASSTELGVDLRPYELRLGTDPGQTLDVIARLSTAGSPSTYVTLRSTDVVEVQMQPLRIEFSSVTGIIDPVSIDIEESETSIEIPDDLEHLQLQSAELVLGFRSTLGLPVSVDLRLEGTNDDGVMVPLLTTIELPAVFPDDPPNHSRTLSSMNSSIVEFLNNLPSRITFRGTAQVGDGVSIGTVSSTDSVSARWSIAAPMTVAVGAQTIDTDAEQLDLDDDLREQLEERLIELTLEAEVTSTLPLAAIAYVGVDSDSLTVFDAPELRLGPIAIPAAGPAGKGTPRPPSIVVSRIVVAQEDIPLILRAGTWQGLRLEIPGTEGEFVSLLSTDAVVVRGFLRARVLVGKVNR